MGPRTDPRARAAVGQRHAGAARPAAIYPPPPAPRASLWRVWSEANEGCASVMVTMMLMLQVELDCRTWPCLPGFPSTGNKSHANCIAIKRSMLSMMPPAPPPSAAHPGPIEPATSDMCDTTMCTGYALDEDGVWRHHSWMLRTQSQLQPAAFPAAAGLPGGGEQIVETTGFRRLLYYGWSRTDADFAALLPAVYPQLRRYEHCSAYRANMDYLPTRWP